MAGPKTTSYDQNITPGGLGRIEFGNSIDFGARSIRSLALSLMAYLLLIRFRYRDIPVQGPWSAFTLKRKFAWHVAQQQIEHTVRLNLKKAA